MLGARKYAKLFDTGQYGRLFFDVGSHARGKTFKIYVLPSNVKISNRSENYFCKDKVLVYGIVSGQPGWTETYGWLHKGKWQEDFNKLVKEREEEIEKEKATQECLKQANEFNERQRISNLLVDYEKEAL